MLTPVSTGVFHLWGEASGMVPGMVPGIRDGCGIDGRGNWATFGRNGLPFGPVPVNW